MTEKIVFQFPDVGDAGAIEDDPALAIFAAQCVHGHSQTELQGGYQSRPDTPRIKQGKPLKYETPAGTRMVIDVPSGARAELGNLAVALFITERFRKADAAISAGRCGVDLLGVWNWRGKNADGGMTGLAGWESIALKGRLVAIAKAGRS